MMRSIWNRGRARDDKPCPIGLWRQTENATQVSGTDNYILEDTLRQPLFYMKNAALIPRFPNIPSCVGEIRRDGFY